MRYKAVIFDFDYTLADATEGIVISMNHALREMGFPPALREVIRKTVGQTLEHAFLMLTGNSDKDDAQRFRAIFKAKADEVMTPSTVLFADTLTVLGSLKEHNVKTGIVTSKNRYRIEEVLEKFDAVNLIDFVVGFEDVENAKPDPEGLLKAIATLGVSNDAVLYVGDHVIDAQTAQSAGVGFAAVTTGTTEAAEFAPYPCLAVCGSLSELHKTLLDV